MNGGANGIDKTYYKKYMVSILKKSIFTKTIGNQYAIYPNFQNISDEFDRYYNSTRPNRERTRRRQRRMDNGGIVRLSEFWRRWSLPSTRPAILPGVQ
ncbi:hypothetical protein CHELA20_52679 [Hyphomicrobiales bacterium]|nr:hypothetical protein CHELA41_22247 [Hyphomicrobiales bacterium]CAH1682595.1 hypothetical protein CHELA20_52679 [Hyphomicrobiales bacterium]